MVKRKSAAISISAKDEATLALRDLGEFIGQHTMAELRPGLEYLNMVDAIKPSQEYTSMGDDELGHNLYLLLGSIDFEAQPPVITAPNEITVALDLLTIMERGVDSFQWHLQNVRFDECQIGYKCVVESDLHTRLGIGMAATKSRAICIALCHYIYTQHLMTIANNTPATMWFKPN